DPSFRTAPVRPSTKQKYGDIATPKSSHAADDCTTSTPGGASSRSLDGLSNAGSLTTTTTLASPGSGSHTAGRRPSQKVRQVRQPVDRNARTVSVPERIDTATGSASSVVPEMSWPSVACRIGAGRCCGIDGVSGRAIVVSRAAG